MMEGDEDIQESEGNNTENMKPPQNQRKKKSKLENKRRFSDEQIRSLECIFESESKLEPRKKMQLARDLGLQPRQVAIWFQNRRARWKSKRMEQEYRKLKDEYDNLASRFESLKKEKDSLQLELQKLNDLMETPHDGKREKSNWGTEVKPSCSNDDREGMHSNAPIEESRKAEKSEERECQLVKMEDKEKVPLAMGSLEKWYSVDPDDYFDQTCSSSQWLDFWG